MNFSDLEIEYQNHFIKSFFITALLFFISIPICILIKKYWYILGCLFIASIYTLYLLTIIHKSLSDQIYIYDLLCTEVVRKEPTLFGREIGLNSCTITLKAASGAKILLPVPYSSPYKVGDTLRIYAEQDSLSCISTNTYTILNPIFMHILDV